MNKKISRVQLFLIVLFALLLSSACAPAATNVGTGAIAPNQDSPAEVQEGQISLDKNFYIVMDGSGSMSYTDCAGTKLRKSRIDVARDAAVQFINKSVPADVNLGLYVFDNAGESERVQLGKSNRPQIIAEISKIRANSGTPLNAAITNASKVLAKQRDHQLGYGEYYMIVVTDGEATDGPTGADNGVNYATKNGIPIITIGFCLSGNHPLSKSSYVYRSAINSEQLLKALEETQGEASYFDATVFSK